MLPWIVDFQKDIYFAFADHIKAFAGGGGWTAFLTFLPMGILLGSVHAMTPGHSKMILASYLTGSSAGPGRALITSIALSFTHVTVSVLIVLLSLPLITMMFGGSGPGSSPVLETISRGMLGIIGLWMILRALSRRKHDHHKREGLMVGVTAGLIPCPLTLFVMNFAVVQHVTVVGVLFAVAMMVGIGITLSVVALLSVVFRERLVALMNGRPGLLEKISRGLEVTVGVNPDGGRHRSGRRMIRISHDAKSKKAPNKSGAFLRIRRDHYARSTTSFTFSFASPLACCA